MSSPRIEQKTTDNVPTGLQPLPSQNTESLSASMLAPAFEVVRQFIKNLGSPVLKAAPIFAALSAISLSTESLPQTVMLGLAAFVPLGMGMFVTPPTEMEVDFSSLEPMERVIAEETYRETLRVIEDIKVLPRTVWFDWDDTLVRSDNWQQIGRTIGMMKAFHDRGARIGIYSMGERSYIMESLDRYYEIDALVSRNADGTPLVEAREDIQSFAEQQGLPSDLKIVDHDELIIDNFPLRGYEIALANLRSSPGNPAADLVRTTMDNYFEVSEPGGVRMNFNGVDFLRLKKILQKIEENRKIDSKMEMPQATTGDFQSQVYRYMTEMYKRFRYEFLGVDFEMPLNEVEEENLRVAIRDTPRVWIELLERLAEGEMYKEYLEISLALGLWPMEVDKNVVHFFERISGEELSAQRILGTYSPPLTLENIFPGYSNLAFSVDHELPSEADITAIDNGLAKLPPALTDPLYEIFATGAMGVLDGELVVELKKAVTTQDILHLFEVLKEEDPFIFIGEESSLTSRQRLQRTRMLIILLFVPAARQKYGRTLIQNLASSVGLGEEVLINWANGIFLTQTSAAIMLTSGMRAARVTSEALRAAILECSRLPVK